MKVLFIWHAAVALPYQSFIKELAEHEDLEITLLIPQWSMEGSKKIKAFIPKNAKYKVLKGWNHYPKDPLIGIYPALPFYLFSIRPDLIHLFEEPYHNLAAYLTFFKGLICPQAKFVFQTFQNLAEDYRSNWVKTQNKTFRTSQAAIACAEEMKKVLLHWGYNKPIRVIYPGVETARFFPQEPKDLRNELGLKEYTIGYFGRMLKEKGVEDLISASHQLDFPHQLLFIGNGPDKEYFKTLTNKAVWLDAVEPNEINKYYSALDVFVLPSRTTKHWKEQFGRVLIESMLCKTPVIGSSSGEIPNVVGEAGLIFKEKDPKDLAQKIRLIHDNPSVKKGLIEKGQKRAPAFDWKISADQVHALYKDLFAGIL